MYKQRLSWNVKIVIITIVLMLCLTTSATAQQMLEAEPICIDMPWWFIRHHVLVLYDDIYSSFATWGYSNLPGSIEAYRDYYKIVPDFSLLDRASIDINSSNGILEITYLGHTPMLKCSIGDHEGTTICSKTRLGDGYSVFSFDNRSTAPTYVKLESVFYPASESFGSTTYEECVYYVIEKDHDELTYTISIYVRTDDGQPFHVDWVERTINGNRQLCMFAERIIPGNDILSFRMYFDKENGYLIQGGGGL